MQLRQSCDWRFITAKSATRHHQHPGFTHLMARSPRLLLFSGMASDQSVLAEQLKQFPDLVVPDWQQPRPAESLAAYCQRWAQQWAEDPPRVIGGASFGGMVALHMAEHLPVRAVVLIGSIRGPADLPGRIRIWRPFRGLVRYLPLAALQALARILATGLVGRWMPQAALVAHVVGNADRELMRWSIKAILDWDQTPLPNCPIFQIHGARDQVLPAPEAQPDVYCPTGGHLISMTRPREVNAFLAKISSTAQGEPLRSTP